MSSEFISAFKRQTAKSFIGLAFSCWSYCVSSRDLGYVLYGNKAPTNVHAKRASNDDVLMPVFVLGLMSSIMYGYLLRIM